MITIDEVAGQLVALIGPEPGPGARVVSLRDRAVLVLLLVTGMRCAELAGLRLCDLEGSTVHFRAKRGRLRTLDLDADSAAILERIYQAATWAPTGGTASRTDCQRSSTGRVQRKVVVARLDAVDASQAALDSGDRGCLRV